MIELSSAVVAGGFAVAVAVVGMPHGGLDHLFGRAVFEPRSGRRWLATFGLFYLGIAALVLAGWFVSPALTVVLFFLISAVHFGDDLSVPQPARSVCGGLVIWVPLLFRPTEVAGLLAWVIPSGDVVRVSDGIASAEPLLWAVAAFFVGWLPFAPGVGVVVRNIVFALLLAVVPTLVGFAVYFCGWHSTRELAELARRANPTNPWLGLRKVALLAAPMAGLAVVATAVAAWWFANGRGLQPVVVQAVFLGLSAVAVPHILLHAVARRSGADPFAAEARAGGSGQFGSERGAA